MVAALDRCRSYRRDPDLKCSLIAVNDQLVAPGSAVDTQGYVISRMSFLGEGFLGSREAALSHAPDKNMGHIWLVDVESGRDCKGEWEEHDGSATWWMLCRDEVRAEGRMTSPREGAGRGSGVTSEGHEVEFVFAPEADAS